MTEKRELKFADVPVLNGNGSMINAPSAVQGGKKNRHTIVAMNEQGEVLNQMWK